MNTKKPQIIKISESTQRVFNFKKLIFGWTAVILAIVTLCLVIEVTVHGW